MIETLDYKHEWVKTEWKSFDEIMGRCYPHNRTFKDETYDYIVVAFRHRYGEPSGEIYRQER